MQAFRSMTRGRAVFVLLALMLVLTLRPAAGFSAGTDDDFQVHYVAHDFHVVGPDYAAAKVGSRTGVQSAPLGRFQFTATDSDMSLRFDDEAPLRLLPVHVSGTFTRGGWHCIPNHGTSNFGGFSAGETIDVQINDPTYGYSMCDVGGATAGIATVIR